MINWFVQPSGIGAIKLPRFIWIGLFILDVMFPDPIFLVDELILLGFSLMPGS